LVCKKVFSQDGKWHIYLREIKTGIEENIVMWVDDDIFPHPNNKNYLTYNYI
jgi:hypothetical protein